MKLNYWLFLSSAVLAQSAFAADLQCKKDYDSIIAKDIHAVSTAYNNDNLQYLADMTDDSVVNFAGGKQALFEKLTLAVSMFKKANMTISEVKTEPPQYSYIVKDNEICFVPKQTKVIIKGRAEYTETNFMLAVRPISSQKWKYVDGSGLIKHPEMLYTLFPDFPRDIQVPFLSQNN